MDQTAQFLLRNKLYTASVYIDASEHPIYVFTILTDKQLILEFGDEVSIKTDGNTILPMKLNYPQLNKLRIALFNSIKTTKEFLVAKEKTQTAKG